MKLRKLLTLGLATASVVGLTTLSAFATGEKIAGYNFEGDNSAWYNSGEGNDTTIINVEKKDVTENGNTFRRLKYDAVSIAKDAQISDVREFPASTIVLDEPIQFAPGQVVKVSAKIRSNLVDNKACSQFGLAINVPERVYDKAKLEEYLATETQNKTVYKWGRNFNTLFKVDSSSGMKIGDCAVGASKYGQTATLMWYPSVQSPTFTAASSTIAQDTWYLVESYLTIGENSTITKIRTVIDKGALGDITTNVNSVTTYGRLALAEQKSLDSIHLWTAFRNSTGDTYSKENIATDFDDIKVIVYGNADELETTYVKWDFEGDNSDWYNGGEGDGTKVTNVEKKDVTENGNTFRRFEFDVAVTATDNQLGDVLQMPASTITLDEPIRFADGQVIKISSKIRSNQFGSSARPQPGIAMNVPEKAYKKDVIATLTGGVHRWNRLFNNLYKVDYSSGSKVYHNASGASKSGATNGLIWGAVTNIPSSDQVSTSNLAANKWYKVDTYLTIGTVDSKAVITKVRTRVNDGALGDVETVVNSDTQNGKVMLANETSLKSLHLYAAWRSAKTTKTDITVDFDDIEIEVLGSTYDSANDFYYISEDYKAGYNPWQIAKNWGTDQADNPMKTTMTTEDGVIKVHGTDTGNNGQYDMVGLHRALPKAIALSDDKDFVIKARIRNTCDTANIQFMVNRGTAYNAGWLQGKNRYNTLLDIGINGISLRGSDSLAVPGFKDIHTVYAGDTLNKWFDVEFYFDSSDKTIYGSVRDEEGNVYSLVSQTDWDKTEIQSFSWVLYDKDADENGFDPVSFELASFDFYEVANDQFVNLTDEEGNEIIEANAGDKVCAKYLFKPDAGDIVKYYAMAALYSKDENGALKLEQVEVKDLGMNMGYYDGMTEAITIPEGGEYVVKAFVWNSATNKPMMGNDEI